MKNLLVKNSFLMASAKNFLDSNVLCLLCIGAKIVAIWMIKEYLLSKAKIN